MQTVHVAEAQPAAMVQDSRLLVPVKDAATALGVSIATAWRLIAKDHLKTRKIGARTLVTMESVRSVAEKGAA